MNFLTIPREFHKLVNFLATSQFLLKSVRISFQLQIRNFQRKTEFSHNFAVFIEEPVNFLSTSQFLLKNIRISL